MKREYIDPESEQIREVFARFGLAIYHAQCLEKQLALILATKYGLGPTRISKMEFDEILKDLDSRTLGQLVSKIRTLADLGEDERGQLEQGLSTRNWLTHRYFWERSVDFLSESGRASMIKELQEASDSLHTLDELFTKRTLVWGETIGVTEESLDQELERLVGESQL